MRVLLDTNVVFSYLLAPEDPARTMVRIVNAVLDGRFILVVPSELMSEILNTVANAPYLRDRIGPEKTRAFFQTLGEIAELPEPLPFDPEPVVRDRKDDFLLAAGHFYAVDVLVSDDKDLLVLRDKVTAFQIMSPREFLALIEG